MGDDKKNKGQQDRIRVAGAEDYEVKYEADKLGVTPDELHASIKRVGNIRADIEADIAARKKKPE